MNIQLLKLNDSYKDEKACKDLIDAYIDLRMSHSRFVTTTYEAHELHDLSDDYDNKKFASDLIVKLKRKVLETGNKLLIKLTGYVDRNDISKLEDYLF